MSVEIRPLQVKCNIACAYCYQNSMRAANETEPYDVDAIKETLTEINKPFAVFGGEPLLIPRKDLEEFFRFGLERYGYNTIQTNGTLVQDDHIELFKRYRVHVGVSIDGPGELNDARISGDLETTRKQTQRSLDAITRLCEADISTSLIVTLHRLNASEERLPRLSSWLRETANLGIKHVRLHLLEADNALVRARYGLSTEENLAVLRYLAPLQQELGEKFFDIYRDIRQMLQGQDRKSSCVWRACDIYNTEAVQAVDGHGALTNCGRTNQLGVDFLKADGHGYERYIALYHTPQEVGGCNGCRFFLFCKGYCPGTAIDNDWRNRTEYCDLLKELFTETEADLLEQGTIPLSQSPHLPAMEAQFLAAWAQGQNPTMERRTVASKQ